MNFSFLNRNRMLDGTIQALSQHLENLRMTVASLSQVIRIDLGPIQKDDARQFLSELHMDQFEELDAIRKYGGNRYFYDMVKGIASGELFPIDRPVYEDTTGAREKRSDYLSLLFMNIDRGDDGIYINTIEGSRLIGTTKHNPFIVKNEKKIEGVWPIVFNKSEPDEIKGEVRVVLDYVRESNLGFDAFFLSTASRYVYSTSGSFEGYATLEPGRPIISLGGLESKYIDQEAINEIIIGDDVMPSQDEIIAAAVDVLERFRLWMGTSSREDCEKAKAIFNQYSHKTLIAIEGYMWQRRDEEEEVKTPDEVYSYRIATTDNLESYTERHIGYRERDIRVYTCDFKTEVTHDFLLPVLGPTEENPDFHKINRAFRTVNLIRLISGLQDFLKQPKEYLEKIVLAD